MRQSAAKNGVQLSLVAAGSGALAARPAGIEFWGAESHTGLEGCTPGAACPGSLDSMPSAYERLRSEEFCNDTVGMCGHGMALKDPSDPRRNSGFQVGKEHLCKPVGSKT